MNAPLWKSTITRAVVAGEGHGDGDAVRPPQDANENVPLAVKTQTHVSGDARLERETSPYRTTWAATICGDDPRNAVLAVARARSRDWLLAGGGIAGGVGGAGEGEAPGDTAGEGEGKLPTSPGAGAPGVGNSARGEPATWVPTRKDPAATTSKASANHPDRGKRRPEGPLTGATGAAYPSPGRVSSSALNVCGRLMVSNPSRSPRRPPGLGCSGVRLTGADRPCT